VIREATKDDLGVFLELWHEMLSENYAIGGEYPASDRNLDAFAGIFSAYVTGAASGVCLLAEDGLSTIGTLLWGEAGPAPFDVRWGRFAVGYGTYVVPSARRSRVATDLRREGRRRLREMGFEAVLGSAVQTNEAGIRSGLDYGGFRLHGILGVIDLREGE
jgi:hypothetical protein